MILIICLIIFILVLLIVELFFSRNENNAMQEEIISLKKVSQFQEYTFFDSFSKVIVIDFMMLVIEKNLTPFSLLPPLYFCSENYTFTKKCHSQTIPTI